jgi:hypothetical protein
MVKWTRKVLSGQGPSGVLHNTGRFCPLFLLSALTGKLKIILLIVDIEKNIPICIFFGKLPLCSIQVFGSYLMDYAQGPEGPLFDMGLENRQSGFFVYGEQGLE